MDRSLLDIVCKDIHSFLKTRLNAGQIYSVLDYEKCIFLNPEVRKTPAGCADVRLIFLDLQTGLRHSFLVAILDLSYYGFDSIQCISKVEHFFNREFQTHISLLKQ